MQLCKEYHVPCLDLFPVFHAEMEKGTRLFRDGIHLNEDGHTLAGGTMYRFLRENGLIALVGS